MDYESLRRRAINALNDGIEKLPNEETEADRRIDAAVRACFDMKPGSLYGFLPVSKEIKLAVPFWQQTDNYRDANRTCFSSSMAMIVEFLSPEKLTGDNDYVETVFSIGDTTDPIVQVKSLAKYGIIGTYRQNMDFADIDKELLAGFPVGIGMLHRGTLDAPTGGHWIVIIGKTADGQSYICNDPYGSLMDGYQGDVTNGKGVHYAVSILKKRWTAEGKNSGWGMACRKKPSPTVESHQPAVGNEIPQAAIDLIKEFEGCELDAYDDGVGVWTIGFGSTKYTDGSSVKPGDHITQQEAEDLFRITLKRFWDNLSSTPFWNEMTSNQKAALLSFSYNSGWTCGKKDFNTMNLVIKEKRWDDAPAAMSLYVNPGTETEAGLRRRRKAESELWLS